MLRATGTRCGFRLRSESLVYLVPSLHYAGSELRLRGTT
jgi:hypothetical protein